MIRKIDQLPDTADADIIIIGSGVAGSALAATLGREGLKVILVEKNFGHLHTIAGEVLQPGGVDALNKLGLKDIIKDIDARDIYGYHITSQYFSGTVQLPYSANTEGKTDVGKIFHHAKFLSKLRSASDLYENITKIEGQATKLVIYKDRVVGVEYIGKNSQSPSVLSAPITVVAEGHFSKFRKLFVPPGVKPNLDSYFLGILIKTDEASDNTTSNFANCILGDPSFIIIYEVSSIHTRVIVDIPPPLPSNIRRFVMDQISPQIPKKYRAQVLEAVGHRDYDLKPSPSTNNIDVADPKLMANSYLCTRPRLIRGTLLIGDMFNMRHPVTGAGMTIALKDVQFWADVIRKLYAKSDETFRMNDKNLVKSIQKTQERFIRARCQSYTFAPDVLAQLLSKVYAPGNNEFLREIQYNCVQYFYLGGIFVSGPMSIVSLNNTSPFTLILHLTGMFLYGIYQSFNLRIRRHKHWMGYGTLIYDLFKLIFISLQIIVPLIWTEARLLV